MDSNDDNIIISEVVVMKHIHWCRDENEDGDRNSDSDSDGG